jgi:hypothetical protein
MLKKQQLEGARKGLLFLLLFLGMSALVGGSGLVADPSGAAIGLPPDLLRGSPFGDYLVPGLVLLIVLGAGPLLAAYGVWTRRRWARLVSFLLGLALILWIGVQIRVIGLQIRPPLQPLYGFIGAAITLLAFVTKSERPQSRR